MWRKRKVTEDRKTPVKNISPQQAMLRRQILIGILLTLLMAGLLSTISYVTRLPSLQIKEVKVVGGITIPHAEVRAAAEEELIGTYIRLVSKRFRWFYPEDAIQKRIIAIDRVKQVELEIDDDKDLVIAFEEYVPLGLWCEHVTTTECLFIDNTGLAFAEAPELTGNAFVRFVTDEPPTVGSLVAESAYIDGARSFIEQLESQLSLFVTHVIKEGDFDTEYQVAGGGRIKISQSIPAEDSFSNLKTILDSDEFAHIEPGTFNYIDLRFGDKVFINEIKDEPIIESATTTEVEGGALVQ